MLRIIGFILLGTLPTACFALGISAYKHFTHFNKEIIIKNVYDYNNSTEPGIPVSFKIQDIDDQVYIVQSTGNNLPLLLNTNSKVEEYYQILNAKKSDNSYNVVGFGNLRKFGILPKVVEIRPLEVIDKYINYHDLYIFFVLF